MNTAQQTGKPNDDKFKFRRAHDSRGRAVDGLWVRNGRFYAQMHVPGKGSRRIVLLDEQKRPARTVSQAVIARNQLLLDRENGRLPGPRITPCFDTYAEHYVSWMKATNAKSILTIKAEKSLLSSWVGFFGHQRLNTITQKQITEFALKRVKEDGVSNRTVNLGVIVLGNLLAFAKNEGWLRGELPTDGWKPLKYVAPKRKLVPWSEIEKICTEALAKNPDGSMKHENGQFLVDYVKLLAFSGARRQAGLSARWDQVDWSNRQISFFTKFDKKVTVDFNDKLEAHLKDLWKRREEGLPWIFPTPRLRGGEGYFANPQKLFNEIKEAAGVKFNFHDLRAWFISYCIMAGVDSLTVASWVGHSDGGVLIGKVYGCLDPKHKRDSARKVSFAGSEVAATKATLQPNQIEDSLKALTVEQLLAALQQRLAQPAPQTTSCTVAADAI